MNNHKPQIIESAEYESENAKGVITVFFFVMMLALFGVLVQVASRVSVVTF